MIAQVRAGAARGCWVIAIASAIWTLLLLASGGFDVAFFGLRLRSTDPVRTATLAIAAAATARVLRWNPAPAWSGIVSAVRSHFPLIAILGVAIGVRLWGITFGLPHPDCRPDEGAINSIARSIYSGTAPSTFNYPPFFMLVIAGVLWLLYRGLWLLGHFGVRLGIDPTATVIMRMIARLLSAFAGVATVWVVFRIGTRLFDRYTGLVASVFLALAFLHVRDSHFGVTDIPMTALVMLAFFWIVKLWESGTTLDLLVAAALTGAATATKYNAVLLVLPASFALLAEPGRHSLRVRGVRILAFVFVLVAVFLILCPSALLNRTQFVRDLAFESHHLATGHGDIDLGRGWTYHLTHSLRYGLGLPLFSASLAGMVLLLRQAPGKGVLVVAFPLAYYVLVGSGRTVFARYILPVIPFLCLTAASFVTTAARWVVTRLHAPRWFGLVATSMVVGLLLPSIRSVIQFDRLLARTDNRLLARRWVEQHFPAGVTIAQAGAPHGRVFHGDANEVRYRLIEITEDMRSAQVILMNSSALTGPANIYGADETLARDYERVLELKASTDDEARIYDLQDEFYLPLAGFKGVERPGPDITIYARRR